jgi:thymidine kinase
MAKLHFYYSAMNAGKSTVLLQASYNYQERGMDTLLLIPQIGARDNGRVTSRIGLEEAAYAFDGDCNLYDYVSARLRQNSNIKCVLLDEAQFLTKDHVWQLANITDDFNVPVLAYGLRTDFRGEIFESSKYLLGLADTLVEVKTICHCGKKATMNIRVDNNGKALKDGEQFEVGGNERYIAVCRKHFREGNTGIKQKSDNH